MKPVLPQKIDLRFGSVDRQTYSGVFTLRRARLARACVRPYHCGRCPVRGVRVSWHDRLLSTFRASGGVRFLAPFRRRLPNDEQRRMIYSSRAAKRRNVCANGKNARIQRKPRAPPGGGRVRGWMLAKAPPRPRAGPGALLGERGSGGR